MQGELAYFLIWCARKELGLRKKGFFYEQTKLRLPHSWLYSWLRGQQCPEKWAEVDLLRSSSKQALCKLGSTEEHLRPRLRGEKKQKLFFSFVFVFTLCNRDHKKVWPRLKEREQHELFLFCLLSFCNRGHKQFLSEPSTEEHLRPRLKVRKNKNSLSLSCLNINGLYFCCFPFAIEATNSSSYYTSLQKACFEDESTFLD